MHFAACNLLSLQIPLRNAFKARANQTHIPKLRFKPGHRQAVLD